VTGYQKQGAIPATAPAENIADVLVAILQGTILRHAILGDVDLDTLRHGVRTLWPAPPPTHRERTP
jgi:TetR/AcrR family transcriptional regulator, transcriptional repressor of aconitase